MYNQWSRRSSGYANEIDGYSDDYVFEALSVYYNVKLDQLGIGHEDWGTVLYEARVYAVRGQDRVNFLSPVGAYMSNDWVKVGEL